MRSKIFGVTLLLGLLWSGTSEAVCDQTISTGADVDATVSAAATGSTICLNSGNYGTVIFTTYTKSPRVTITSTTGQGATLGIDMTNGTNGLTFDSLTLIDSQIFGASTRNITIQNSAFGTYQLYIGAAGWDANNILIDSNTFGAFDAVATYEGRLSIIGGDTVAVGVVVSNNTFGPGGCSDGVHTGSYGVVIGPGNLFTGLLRGVCEVHVDSIQGYGQSHTTITNNHFVGNSIDVGIYDGGNTEVITGNLMEDGINGSSCGDCNGSTWTHNTVNAGTWGINGKTYSGSNALVRDNIFIGTSGGWTFEQDATNACATNCTATHNLMLTSSSCENPVAYGGCGTSNVIATPVFIVTPPVNWADWQLHSSSDGYQEATDPAGGDMGITYYGSGTDTTPPSIPTGVVVTRLEGGR